MNTEYNRDTAIKAIADLHTRLKAKEEKQQLIKDIKNAYDNKNNFIDKIGIERFKRILADKDCREYKEYIALRSIYNKLEDLYTKKYR